MIVLKLFAGLKTGASPEAKGRTYGGKCILCMWLLLIKFAPKTMNQCVPSSEYHLLEPGIAPFLSSNFLRHAIGDDKSAANSQDSSSCFADASAVEGCGAGSGDRPTGRGRYRHFYLSVLLVHLPVRETLSRQPPSNPGKGQ